MDLELYKFACLVISRYYHHYQLSSYLVSVLRIVLPASFHFPPPFFSSSCMAKVV